MDSMHPEGMPERTATEAAVTEFCSRVWWLSLSLCLPVVGDDNLDTC